MMAKKQDLKYEDLVSIKPITDNQKVVFKEYAKGRIFFYMVNLELVKHLYHFFLHYKKY